jgi:GNAT superfamily N-acetyltransferase
MTALEKYQRIEASGLWRPDPQTQRREVIVSIGDATLIITDMQERALTHWSLAAVERANPGELPALYHPDGDPGEELELADTESEMISAIEKLRQAVGRGRAKPGRLRLMILGFVVLTMGLLGTLWLPGAMLRHTVRVVPEVKRQDLGTRLLSHAERVTGQACAAPGTAAVLAHLAQRVQLPGHGASQIVVMRAGLSETVMLPGQILLISRRLIEEYEDPAVVAGFILAELTRSAPSDPKTDPLAQLLDQSGFAGTLRLLTTGTLPQDTLAGYAETVLANPRSPVPDEALLNAFAQAQISAAPYAYALDVSGEATLPLIEADPLRGQAPKMILDDAQWVRLQEICNAQ